MTPDTIKQHKRPRWFSPRGAVFWVLSPGVVFAATFAVLMFWPGLAYDWRSSDGAFGLVRRPLSANVAGTRGDAFWVHAKWCGIGKVWDPDDTLRHSSRFYIDSECVEFGLGDHRFVFAWSLP